MDIEGRRNGVVKLIRTLKERGLRIDAVGMQGHMGMDHPDINEFEKSMMAFAAEGVKVMITEWDMSALPTVKQGANIADTLAYQAALNPYTESLPDSVSKVWNTRMKQFFQLFEKHADVITRVTAWGLTDNDSWKNDFPIKGRTDYPLLFDRNYQPKPFVKELMEEASAEQPVK
jgi:endo-1,4-beta-xylanase